MVGNWESEDTCEYLCICAYVWITGSVWLESRVVGSSLLANTRRENNFIFGMVIRFARFKIEQTVSGITGVMDALLIPINVRCDEKNSHAARPSQLLLSRVPDRGCLLLPLFCYCLAPKERDEKHQ